MYQRLKREQVEAYRHDGFTAPVDVLGPDDVARLRRSWKASRGHLASRWIFQSGRSPIFCSTGPMKSFIGPRFSMPSRI